MLNGTLKTFSLSSLLQICSNENNTGTLEFYMNNTLCGRVGFDNGDAMYADFLGMKGVDAVRQISLLKEIDFKYNNANAISEKNIDWDINFLIIDSTRYADESVAYLNELKNTIKEKYAIESLNFFEYDNRVFSSLNLHGVRYFESYDEDKFKVVCLDKNIKARIQIVFNQKILTDSLLIYMIGKGIL
ncbi:MAG: DUF4388 domain-containing protein [Desulfamplus sp.]|nr:DUF4388 domain-containing protein [Desulfamplus sp.]MBF0411202.1 DUF4388 domain-containing protein [Desulfamplus sp.]